MARRQQTTSTTKCIDQGSNSCKFSTEQIWVRKTRHVKIVTSTRWRRSALNSPPQKNTLARSVRPQFTRFSKSLRSSTASKSKALTSRTLSMTTWNSRCWLNWSGGGSWRSIQSCAWWWLSTLRLRHTSVTQTRLQSVRLNAVFHNTACTHDCALFDGGHIPSQWRNN